MMVMALQALQWMLLVSGLHKQLQVQMLWREMRARHERHAEGFGRVYIVERCAGAFYKCQYMRAVMQQRKAEHELTAVVDGHSSKLI